MFFYDHNYHIRLRSNIISSPSSTVTSVTSTSTSSEKTITMEILKEILQKEESIGELKRQGYELAFDDYLGTEMDRDQLYRINNTDISLIAYQKTKDSKNSHF